jgi:hypothetical protein
MTEAQPDLNDIYRVVRELQASQSKKLCQKCGRPVETDGPLCDNCRNTIGVRAWAEDSSLEPSSREKRRQLLQKYALANGKNLTPVQSGKKGIARAAKKGIPIEQIVEAVESMNEEVRSGKASLYDFSKTLIDWLRKKHTTPYSLKIQRSQLPGFFESEG